MSERIAYIRTSDIAKFLACRRKWDWSSHLRQNWESSYQKAPLWLGTGVHYALEDYYGYKVYPTLVAAFKAYIKATNKYSKSNGGYQLPDDVKENADLGVKMLEHYQEWLVNREDYPTFIFNGVPQVEPSIQIEVPIEQLQCSEIALHYDKIIYALQLDRVAIIDGELFVVEYKTAKNISSSHLINDAQISSYAWALSKAYDMPVGGIIYLQIKKSFPAPPRILKNGCLSSASQNTTYKLYKQAVIDKYSNIELAPEKIIKRLNILNELEQSDSNSFVRRDFIYRDSFELQAVQDRLIQVISDMLRPDLQIYSHITRDCYTFCDFNSACLSKDSGGDYLHELQATMVKKSNSYDAWRNYL